MPYPWKQEAQLGLQYAGSQRVRLELSSDFNTVVDAAMRLPPEVANRVIVWADLNGVSELRIDALREWAHQRSRPAVRRPLDMLAGIPLASNEH